MGLSLVHKFDLNTREIVFGAAAALSLRVLGAFAQFGFNLLLARMLGADGMGIYSLAFSVSVISSTIARLGIDQALLRFIAIQADQQKWDQMKGVFAKGMTIVFLSGFVITIIVFLLAPWLSQSLFDEPRLALPLQIMSFSIVPFSLVNLLAEALRALKRVANAMLVQGMLVPALSVGLFLTLLSLRVGLLSAVLAYVLATVFVLLIGAWLWKRVVPQLWRPRLKGQFATHDLLTVSFPMAWASIMVIVFGLADSVILGIFRSAAEVGIYAAAQRMALLTTFSLIAVNSVAAPKFAALYKAGDFNTIEKIAQKSNVLMILIASPLLLAFFLFPERIMGIFGQDFVAGRNALIIISIGQVVNVATGSVGCLLLMTSYEKIMKWINVSAAMSNIVLSWILIPKFGVIGAAFASSISLALLNCLALFSVFKLLTISTVPFISIAARSN